MVDSELRMLRDHGHEVCIADKHSDTIRQRGISGSVIGGLSTPWNAIAQRQLRRLIEAYQPDVVHVHNSFPLWSPAVFYAIPKGVARVMTLHNYRLFCAAGVPVRNGKICTLCLDRRGSFPALKYGCYRDSRIATAPLAVSVALHRTLRTWQRKIDRFITLTQFQKNDMDAAGLPVERIRVKPNFYPGNPVPVQWEKRHRQIVFVGRLSREKGVDILLDAWKQWGTHAPELIVVGDGPDRASLESSARSSIGNRISFRGLLSSEEAQRVIAESRLLVVPSTCYEGFPMVIREAFAFGTPVAASKIGALPSIVREEVNGVVFTPGDCQSLLRVLKTIWANEERLQHLSEGARREFESFYTEDQNYRLLMEIYTEAIGMQRATSILQP